MHTPPTATSEYPAPHLIQVQPNCSMSWRGALLFYGWVASVSLGVATGFAVAGYWPVLPFAGLELAGLGAALWVTMRRGQYREVISLYPDVVRIEKGHSDRRECVEFPRYWARVTLRPARFTTHPSRLEIRSHGRVCEVGHCLTETERRGLWKRLGQLIGGTEDDGAPPQRDRQGVASP